MATGQPVPRRVFLSHTSELRRFPAAGSFVSAAEAAIIRAGCTIADMEYFPVMDQTPERVCREAVQAADIYILIAGFTYGSTVPGRPDLAYTELEFEAASEAGIPRLAFLISEEAQGPAAFFIDLAHGDRQLAFRTRIIQSGLVAAVVTTPDKLETAVFHALTRIQHGDPLWGLAETHPKKRLPVPRLVRGENLPAENSDRPVTGDRPPRAAVDIGGTDSLERRLRNYYGYQTCVVDGEADGDSEWIALDENTANISFGNLIPLSRRHRLRPAGHRSWQWSSEVRYRFSVDLTAENLLHQSRKHFHQGSPSLAFGCARLGECLAMRSPDDFEAQEDDGWAFLTQCIFYLPYRLDIELLQVLLHRICTWVDATPYCPRVRRTSLLLALANLYQDMSDWKRADQLYELVLREDLLAMPRAATIRRRTIGGYFGPISRAEFSRAFDEVDSLRTPADFRLSVAIAKSWWFIQNDEPGLALQLMEPFDFDEDSLREASDYSPHNSLELKLTQAAALSSLRLDSAAQARIINHIVKVMRNTRLRPIFTDHVAPVLLTPELQELIAPLRSPMLTTPALLMAMDEAARKLIDAPVRDLPGRPTWVD